MNPQGSQSSQSTGFMEYKNKLEAFLHTYLVQKAPALPKGFKDFVVVYGPWICLFFLVLGVLALIIILPLLFAATAITAAVSTTTGSGLLGLGTFGVLISLVFSVPQLILEGLAIPGLLKRVKRNGWDYFFYAQLLGIVYEIITFNILGLLVSILALYVLFQVREYYS